MGFLRSWLQSTSADDEQGDATGSAQRFIDAGSATDVGSREENQDRIAVSPSWAIVSDGVGGRAGGSIAAELTVSNVVAQFGSTETGFDHDLLTAAVSDANEAVRAARNGDLTVSNMGATLTMAALMEVEPGRSRWLVANIGDSPAWLVTSEGGTQVTEDHTLTSALLRSGALTAEEAANHPQRHVIVRAIGVEEWVEADMQIFVLTPGDALVIASDGLSDVLDPTEIAEVVTSAPTARAAADALVEAALERGTADNVTVAVLRHR